MKMRIRNLKEKDAYYMLEWMLDDFVVHDLRTCFADKTIEDCKSFIESARDESISVHRAIVDDNDEYMGTVSLKNIINHSAEFGIVVRKSAMGRGFSHYGMTSIIDYGFFEKELNYIYWCVDPNNTRAIRFYDKNGYQRCASPENVQKYSVEEVNKYIWYGVKKA